MNMLRNDTAPGNLLFIILILVLSTSPGPLLLPQSPNLFNALAPPLSQLTVALPQASHLPGYASGCWEFLGLGLGLSLHVFSWPCKYLKQLMRATSSGLRTALRFFSGRPLLLFGLGCHGPNVNSSRTHCGHFRWQKCRPHKAF